MRQLDVLPIMGLWAGLCLAGGLHASWQGAGGRGFAATLTAFCFLFGVMLLFAARGVSDRFAAGFGQGGGLILGAAVYLAYVTYGLGTGTVSWERLGAIAILVFVPLALAFSAKGAKAGCWQDFLILAGVWVFVKFSPSHWLWPYPAQKLAYTFTVLVAVGTALACFVLVRRSGGIGYSIGWGKRWGIWIIASYVIFACIAIPLGMEMHFIRFAPQWRHWSGLVFTPVAILFFTAWPEEFLFRGLLQNLLGKASKSETAGWWTASILFGFSHITNLGFPNWRYVLLASIAGLFYGWTWRKTGSIFASAILHAAVDVTWHFLFHS
jgi:CAAX protease family protein